jgi:hypothetical protein
MSDARDYSRTSITWLIGFIPSVALRTFNPQP